MDHARNFLTSYLPSSGLATSRTRLCDLRIHCSDGALLSHGLFLAATSGMLREALLDLSSQEEQRFDLILPDFRLEQVARLLDRMLTWGSSLGDVEDDDEDDGILRVLNIWQQGESGKTVEKSRLSCPACSRTFGSRKLLRRHESSVHSVDNPHACPVCRHPCRSRSELVVHTRVHTGEKPHGCPLENCERSFAQVSQLNDHLKTVHGCSSAEGLRSSSRLRRQTSEEGTGTTVTTSGARIAGKGKRRFVCKECGKTLSTSYSLKLHLGVHSADSRPMFACSHCGKKFTQRSHLTVHERVHTGSRPHMCPRCGKRFAAASNMKKHHQAHDKEAKEEEEVRQREQQQQAALLDSSSLEKHLSEPPFTASPAKETPSLFPCPDCPNVSHSLSALKKHSISHSGVKSHQCHCCQKRFGQRSHLNHHLRTVHAPPGERPRTHTCPDCRQSFTSSSSLHKHRRTHTNDRPFECDNCDKKFIQKVHLQAHELKHSGERPYLCNVCGNSFTTKSNLKEHSKIHTGEKKVYVCIECNAQYVNLCDLRIHLRKHSGEAPFSCSFCGKNFRASRHLADHQRTHTGQKPFHCRNCNKSFGAAGGLRLHFKRSDTCLSVAGAFAMGSSSFDGLLLLPAAEADLSQVEEVMGFDDDGGVIGDSSGQAEEEEDAIMLAAHDVDDTGILQEMTAEPKIYI